MNLPCDVSAPAKINLWLDVLRRRPDGFHDIDTLFLALDKPADRLTFEPADGDTDTFDLDGPFAGDAPLGRDNLVRQALALWRATFPDSSIPPLATTLEKNIPAGAGLGGGSSDVAAVLRTLNELSGSNISPERLEQLAATLGSDCAFFIRAGAQRAIGRGNELTPVVGLPPLALVLVVPDIAIATPGAYAALRDDDKGPRTDTAAALRWLADVLAPPPPIHNAFERHAAAHHPAVRQTLDLLARRGARLARLTGSGSACFGIFPDLNAARAAARDWPLAARLVVATQAGTP